MLPTFVIGLREGLEAALIVGIIAAFLRQQGRRDVLRSVFLGVGIAVVICVSIGVVLKLVSEDLPQRQQEAMETVIGVIAVGMVTYMVIWMKRHSRDLKGQLVGMASDAIGGSSRGGRAMIAMAFLAVLREGIETVVFLLATFNESHSGAAGPAGALLGLAVAVGLGYGIYRGGVRLNLSKFFRATGLVLVLVAAGLVVNALHTAHEAGWLNAGQAATVDLTWLVHPGSVQSSLLTGMLGIQPRPVLIETVGWLVYLVPVGLFVAWPPGKALARQTASQVLLGVGAVVGVTAVVLFTVMPARPTAPPQAAAVAGTTITVDAHREVTATRGGSTWVLTKASSVVLDGVTLDVWKTHASVARPGMSQLSWTKIAELNGGRLPIGATPGASLSGSVRYTDVSDYSAYLDPRTGLVVEIEVAQKVLATLIDNGRELPLADAVSHSVATTPAGSIRTAIRAAASDHAALDDRSTLTGFGWFAAAGAALSTLVGAVLRRRPKASASADLRHTIPRESLVRS